jgi:Spy/CpxP family protein refolding chaperone
MFRTMITLKALAVVAAGMFAAASVFGAEGHACCAKGGEKMADKKAECGMSFASLNLTKEQETKMKAAAEDCKKGGCSEQSMAAMNQKAQQILTKEQFATWKEAGCGHDKADKGTRS